MPSNLTTMGPDCTATLADPTTQADMQTQHDAAPETRILPSPSKESRLSDDMKALTTARIIKVSNPSAIHKYAEPELSAYLLATLPESLITTKFKEILTTSYVHPKKAFDVLTTIAAVEYLEKIGARDVTFDITVDAFTDKKGIAWRMCEYILQFMPYQGDMSVKAKKVDSKFWFTCPIKACILHNHETIATTITESLKKANLRRTRSGFCHR